MSLSFDEYEHEYDNLSSEAKKWVWLIETDLHPTHNPDIREIILSQVGEEADEQLDAFLEGTHFRIKVWGLSTVVTSLQCEYFHLCTTDRLLAAHSQYYGTDIGVDCIQGIVCILVEKLIIEEKSEDALPTLEGLILMGLPDGHTDLLKTAGNLAVDIAAIYGSPVGQLVERVSVHLPQRQKTALNALLEVPPIQRGEIWQSMRSRS